MADIFTKLLLRDTFTRHGKGIGLVFPKATIRHRFKQKRDGKD